MRYVARTIALLSIQSLLTAGCSLRILGVDKSALTTDSGINAFSILGATGGSDASADAYLTDGTTLTADWVDTTGEDSYEVKILDGTGGTTLCGPTTVASDSTSHTFSGCALSHGVTYRIQVTAKNSTTNAAQSAQSTFQVGPFISVGDVSVNEWGIASIPVSLSYAVASAVSIQYFSADSTATSGTDYIHAPLSTLTIPGGQTSATISIPIFTDRDTESSEEFRVEISSPSGAGLLTPNAKIIVLDNDLSAGSGFIEVSAGYDHSCALTSTGGVKCWGRNNYGQLGDNSTTDRLTPTAVLDLTSGVIQIAASGNHTCALLSSGAVKCWGFNFYGQLGDNSTTSRSVPTDVLGLSSGITRIAAGYSHNCAVTTSGSVKCWGYNSIGQIGDNSTTNRLIPTNVFGLSSGVTQLAAGDMHTCAITSTGAAKCWGWNFYGQLGDNSTTSRPVPTDVSGLSSGVTQIAASNMNTCALTSTGAVKCWGYNLYGQIGDNTTTYRLIPTDVFALSSGVTQITSGYGYVCALTSSGAVKCWGRNFYGQIGDNSKTDRLIPSDVSGLSSDITQISAGDGHACARSSSGTLKCWGKHSYGQIGDNSSLLRPVPTSVLGLTSEVLQVSTGLEHNCTLSATGSVKCWGWNIGGQIGDNSTVDRHIPTDVSGLISGATQIASGGTHSCAIISSGAIKCWGQNSNGEIGDNSLTPRLTPTDVQGLSSGMTQVTAGSAHTCALSTGGAARCWGRNNYGEIGDNSTTNRSIPTDVLGLAAGVIQIAAGLYHTCGLISGGAVKCWGRNNYGQLGDNSTVDHLIPTGVSALSSSVTQIVAGAFHACALTSGGAVKCWGRNNYGQIGDNSSVDRLIPTEVQALPSGIAQITAGDYHTCARTSSGAVLCWGLNEQGQLGDQSTTNRLLPANVSNLSSGITQVAAGSKHTCALTYSGSLHCWGSNASGKIGDGYMTLVPRTVVAP